MALPKVNAKRQHGGSSVELLAVMLTVLNELTKQWELFLIKFDADAVAQNAAVTASQLDTDYEATLQTAPIAEINLI